MGPKIDGLSGRQGVRLRGRGGQGGGEKNPPYRGTPAVIEPYNTA